MLKTEKRFDCVEMKREGQTAIYEKLKDMPVEEQIEYWKRGTRDLRERIEAARGKA